MMFKLALVYRRKGSESYGCTFYPNLGSNTQSWEVYLTSLNLSLFIWKTGIILIISALWGCDWIFKELMYIKHQHKAQQGLSRWVPRWHKEMPPRPVSRRKLEMWSAELTGTCFLCWRVMLTIWVSTYIWSLETKPPPPRCVPVVTAQ